MGPQAAALIAYQIVRDQVREGEAQRPTFRGGRISELPRANRSYPRNRVCAAEGCTTKLSIYNRSEFCWQHEPVHTYVSRGKRRRKEAA
jgi:hypothetical protein